MRRLQWGPGRGDSAHAALVVGGIAVALGGAALFGMVAHTWTPFLPQKGAFASPFDAMARAKPVAPSTELIPLRKKFFDAIPLESRVADIQTVAAAVTVVPPDSLAPREFVVDESAPPLAMEKPVETKPAELKTVEIAFLGATSTEAVPSSSETLAEPPAIERVAEAPFVPKPVVIRVADVKVAGAGAGKSTEIRLVQGGTAEAHALKPKAPEPKRVEPKPAPRLAEAKAAPRLAETRPAASKPAEPKAAATKVAFGKPVPAKVAEARPAPKPAEARPVATKVAEAKAVARPEVRPVAARAPEAKPAMQKVAAVPRVEPKPVAMKVSLRAPEPQRPEMKRVSEARATEAKHPETRRVADAKSVEARFAETKRAAEMKAEEERLAEVKRATEVKAAEVKAAEERLAESQRAFETKAAEAKLAETKRAVDLTLAEAKLAEARLAETKRAVEMTLAQARPAQAKPAVETRTQAAIPALPRYERCDNCGTVTSAVSRSGYYGARNWEVRVDFPDGSDRVFIYPTDPGFMIGDRVRFESGRLTRQYQRRNTNYSPA